METTSLSDAFKLQSHRVKMLLGVLARRWSASAGTRSIFRAVACLWEGDVGRHAELSVETEGLDVCIKPIITNSSQLQQRPAESSASLWLEGNCDSVHQTSEESGTVPGFFANRSGRKTSWSFMPHSDTWNVMPKLTGARLLLQLPLHCGNVCVCG